MGTMLNIKSFKNYQQYLSEAKSCGVAMEHVIVSAINGNPKGDKDCNIDAEAGQKVADFLKNNGVTGKAKVLGADTIDVTKEWSKFWDGKVPSSTKTPKTDFTVGSAKISLKTGGAAQLMSGGKNESVATFYAALNKTKGSMLDEVAKRLTDMFEGLAPSSIASSKLGQVIKDKSDEVVNKAEKAHKELMSELKSIFIENTEFRNAFAYEAMSGEQKFGGNAGTCTHFLVTEFDGSNSKLHSVKDAKYVSDIASKMKVSVRFKSTSVKRNKVKTGEYRYWSAVGLIIDKMNEDANALIASGDNLTEAKITDFFKNIWQKIKKFFAKAVKYVKKGVKNAFDFLQVTPEISFNNTISF